MNNVLLKCMEGPGTMGCEASRESNAFLQTMSLGDTMPVVSINWLPLSPEWSVDLVQSLRDPAQDADELIASNEGDEWAFCDDWLNR